MTFNPETQEILNRRKALSIEITETRSPAQRQKLIDERRRIDATLGRAYRKGTTEDAFGAAYTAGPETEEDQSNANP
jgi:hypothetical protein